MTVRQYRPAQLLAPAIEQLRAAGVASPENDARLLLAWAGGVEPWQLATETIDETDARRFNELVNARAAGNPLQYLTGVAYFRTINVGVGPGVFIPRPETEGLVQLVIDWLAGLAVTENKQPIVVELGTGSGAIAEALAQETTAQVYTVENSPDAFTYARRNLAGSGVDLRLGDWAEAFPELNGRADAVITNPPYIPATVAVPPDVAQEPPAALFAGLDGLDALRALLPVAAKLLRPGGLLACEHDDSQGATAPALVAAGGCFTQVADHDDLAGRPRYVTARRNTAIAVPVPGRDDDDKVEL